jgi:acetyl esterase/lipase
MRKSMMRCRLLIQPILLSNLISAAVAAQGPAYVQHENVVYGEVDGVGLVMDVFTPTGKSNGLGIVDVISGAWHSDRGKIRDHDRAQTFYILCGRGYTVFAIRPGSISKFSAFEMLANLNTGIRWVKDHAQSYKIDPDRLGLMGASAGGHLACLAAVSGKAARAEADGKDPAAGTDVKAVAVFFPATDFLNFDGKAVDVRATGRTGERIRQLVFPAGLGDASDAEIDARLKEISPARLVTPQCPPFLLIHGDADPVVPLQQSELMIAALKQAGVPAELIVKQGGGHPWLTIYEEVQKIADWFDMQLAPK